MVHRGHPTCDASSSRFPRRRSFILLLAILAGCGSTKPITVRPQLEEFDLTQVRCPDTHRRFIIDDAIDKRGYGDPNNIGFTQTGMFNAKTTLLSEPRPT